MSDKNISCEVIKEYFTVDDKDKTCIKVSEIKWNNKTPKGYDIRKYDKESDMYLKGVTVSYEGFKDLIYNAVEMGLVDLNVLRECIDKRESKLISSSDFDDLFKDVRNKMSYTRLGNGLLVNDDNLIVMEKRRRK